MKIKGLFILICSCNDDFNLPLLRSYNIIISFKGPQGSKGGRGLDGAGGAKGPEGASGPPGLPGARGAPVSSTHYSCH